MTITCTGLVANPFKFSTKYTDDINGLVYYGFRFYNVELGRWLNRDPMGESGGVNLSAFVNNNPVQCVDNLGLYEGTISTSIRDANNPLDRPLGNASLKFEFFCNRGKPSINFDSAGGDFTGAVTGYQVGVAFCAFSQNYVLKTGIRYTEGNTPYLDRNNVVRYSIKVFVTFKLYENTGYQPGASAGAVSVALPTIYGADDEVGRETMEIEFMCVCGGNLIKGPRNVDRSWDVEEPLVWSLVVD